nr:tripartite motif-containing protein 5-like [Lytechinus pictus]
MAAKISENKFEDLNCSICLEIFDDPTILGCGHTFCRKCLGNYDKRRKAYNDMECPICKQVTQLDKNRVQSLPANVSLRGLVDELNDKQELEQLIKGVTQICTIHCEDEQYFCDDCSKTMCSFCLGTGEHREHAIRKKEDIVNEARKRETKLSARCKKTKAKILREIDICEEHRLELNTSLTRANREISDAFDRKTVHLPLEKKTRLLTQALSLHSLQDKKLNVDVTKHKKVIRDIDALLSELNQSFKMLYDGSMVAAHVAISDELEDLLMKEENIQDTSEANEETLKRLKFVPASDSIPALGTVRLSREKRYLQQRFSDESQTMQHLSDITENSSSLTIIRMISLSGSIQDITRMSKDTVLAVYGSSKPGSDRVCVSGKVDQHLPADVGEVCSIASLTDNRSVVSQQSHTVRIFNPDGSPTGVKYTCKSGSYFLRTCSDQVDNIYAVNGNQEIYIYGGEDPNREQQVIPITHTRDFKPEQISVMKSGVMVVTTRGSKPGAITFLDQNGHVIRSITASHRHEHLYTAVDTMDRVFVAGVRLSSNCLTLSMYELWDKTLNRLMNPTDISLSHTIGNMSTCSLQCLTPSLLAFSRQKQLYFIEVT